MILLSILVTVGGAFFMIRPLNRAVQAQRELTAQFGVAQAYTPPARLDPQRIKVFLAVRKQVMGSCEKFQDITGKFQAMNELDNGGNPPPVGDILKNVKGVMGAAFGMAGSMGEVARIRNTVLQEQGMGLGEYTWIYILAYNSYLGMAPNTGIDGNKGHGYRGHMLDLITSLMENHAGALDEAGSPDSAALWRDEAARLERATEGAPFPAGELPDGLSQIFAPFGEQLARNYCPDMAEFDLGRIEKKGLSFHSD